MTDLNRNKPEKEIDMTLTELRKAINNQPQGTEFNFVINLNSYNKEVKTNEKKH